MGVSKNRGKPPKMDGGFIIENPMSKWMIWGENPTIFGHIHIIFDELTLVCLII